MFFAQNILTHIDSRLTCVDPFVMSTKEQFLANAQAVGCLDKIELIHVASDKTQLDFKMWDFIYVDGLHTSKASLFDAVRSWVTLKKGGILIWDDYQWRMNELAHIDCPKMGIDAFLNICQKELKILHIGAQVIVEKTA